MPKLEVFGNLEVPAPESNLSGDTVLMSGWCFARGSSVVSVVGMMDMQPIGYAYLDRERSDVAAAHPGVAAAELSGFLIEADVSQFEAGQHLVWLRVNLEGGGFKDIYQRFVNLVGPIHEGRRRAIRPLLVCPFCHTGLRDEPDALFCDTCGRRAPVLDGAPVFAGGVDGPPPGFLSVSPYGPTALALVYEYADGLVLDCGAGYPTQSFANVVQFDMFRFPSTDVAGDALRLPFADNVFDAVISQAVLEHVTDPFAYAREVLRVLKPGGKVLVDAAFMQPVHAYPHHYFNTTLMGLGEVMLPFEVIEEGVAAHQKPWVMLNWVLLRYVAGLSSERERKAMLNSTVADILRKLGQGAPQPPFDSLTAEAEQELAAGVYYLGRKPAE